MDQEIRNLFQRGTMLPSEIARIISARHGVQMSQDEVIERNMRAPSRMAWCSRCGRVTKLERAFMYHKDGCAPCARRAYAAAMRAAMGRENACL